MIHIQPKTKDGKFKFIVTRKKLVKPGKNHTNTQWAELLSGLLYSSICTTLTLMYLLVQICELENYLQKFTTLKVA